MSIEDEYLNDPLGEKRREEERGALQLKKFKRFFVVLILFCLLLIFYLPR
ncbi:MAG: hypothetical protein HOM84_01090 [Thiotrichales bacterium]|jgi:hypothetical protein|nr:hypothetical protein [Thiotrichales bacterium]MBT3613249.1 hypothetical protein [Thiotrichales bacterium]MBT3752723.1 hypothetical protein [Thiotrichales bacterium]MBT3837044.1 hypothetical protein [Thiotrichales bacterium]MBT4152551.1 hypothetical protein [Thiotrichales bacterium]